MEEMQSNFVAAAERATVDHVVKLSAAGADPTTSWDIARWHGKIEAQIEASGMDHTFVRPVSYMQNLLDGGAPEWLADAMVGLEVAFGKGIADLNNEHVVQVTGETARDFETFARDHADTFAK